MKQLTMILALVIIVLSTPSNLHAQWVKKASGDVNSMTMVGGALFAGGELSGADTLGVIRSTDGGASWQRVLQEISRISYLSTIGSSLFLSKGGVNVSPDTGKSHYPLAGAPIRGINVVGVLNKKVFSLTTQDISTSTDGGTTWSDFPENGRAFVVSGGQLFLGRSGPVKLGTRLVDQTSILRSSDEGAT
jgi:hypothetical protein